jgi:predicted aspartyl protease
LLAGSNGAEAACRAEPRASVPVALSHNQAVVAVALNGQDWPLLLDTGGGRSLLTAAAVQRANLPLDEWVSTPLLGAGNLVENRRNVTLRSMALGGLPLQRRGLAHTISLPVTAQPLDGAGRIAGLLGADMLSRYDLDLDFPAGRMTLYTVSGCSGRFLPWDQPYDAIAARLLPDDGLLVPVLIDGRPLDAQLDTGSASSLIDARGLHRLGLTPAALDHDTVTRSSGIGGQFLDRRHRFAELRIGTERIAAPVIGVAAVPRPGVDMLLGMDVLASRRIWISYATAQLFIARPGGRNPPP